MIQQPAKQLQANVYGRMGPRESGTMHPKLLNVRVACTHFHILYICLHSLFCLCLRCENTQTNWINLWRFLVSKARKTNRCQLKYRLKNFSSDQNIDELNEEYNKLWQNTYISIDSILGSLSLLLFFARYHTHTLTYTFAHSSLTFTRCLIILFWWIHILAAQQQTQEHSWQRSFDACKSSSIHIHTRILVHHAENVSVCDIMSSIHSPVTNTKAFRHNLRNNSSNNKNKNNNNNNHHHRHHKWQIQSIISLFSRSRENYYQKIGDDDNNDIEVE